MRLSQKVIKSDVGNIYRDVSKPASVASAAEAVVEQNGASISDTIRHGTHLSSHKIPSPNKNSTPLHHTHAPPTPKIPTPTHFGNHLTSPGLNHSSGSLQPPPPSSRHPVEDDCGILDLSVSKNPRLHSPGPSSSSRPYSSSSSAAAPKSSITSHPSDYGRSRPPATVATRPAPPSGRMLTSPANSAKPKSRRRSKPASSSTLAPPPAQAPPPAPAVAPATASGMSPAFMAAAASAMGHYEQRYAGHLNDVPAVIVMMCTLQALSGYPSPESLEFSAVVRAQMSAVGISEADSTTYLEIFSGYCGVYSNIDIYIYYAMTSLRTYL